MTTITTKQLREDMPMVVRTLRRGQPVELMYRHKLIGTIQPPASEPKPIRRGSAEAVRQASTALEKLHVPDKIRNDPRSVKERLAEMRNQDRATE